jgi:V8-like Glu-specific endopeptidase
MAKDLLETLESTEQQSVPDELERAPLSAKTRIHTLNEIQQTKEYWTPERMNAAKPYPLPMLSPEQLQALKQYEKQPSRSRIPVILEGDLMEQVQGIPQVADVNQRPFWNGGRFFFTTPQGDFTGTAEFVGANNIVMTAAHCVIDPLTGVYYDNLMFYRAYNNGGGQKIGASVVSVMSNFSNPAIPVKTPWDYAFILTNDISQAGWLGLQINLPYSSWTSIGYPGNFGNGQQMYQVSGTGVYSGGGIVFMNGNPMTQGASGGAWIGALSPNYAPFNNMAIGLNSGGGPGGQVSGPYFDETFYSLFEHVKNFPNPPQ